MIRVSKERDGMMSPDLQRVAIEDYARTRGYVVTAWMEGIDQSGSQSRSGWWKTLDRGVESVRAGDADVVLVWKFSRAARHRLKWAIAIDAVEAAGGRLESATEQLDTSTSAGRFARGMLAELSAFEAERIGEGWKETHAARLARGLAPTGKPRFGYAWDATEKIHVPDSETGPVLAEVYRRYAAGASFHALVRWLNGEGVPTLSGGMWADHTLRRVLDSGFAAGEIVWNGQRHPGAHEPLIDADLWQAYRDRREERRVIPARVKRSRYLLSGLVRCGHCGGAMVANPPTSEKGPQFRCVTSKTMGKQACVGGYTAMAHVEAKVLEWVRSEAAVDVDEAARRAKVADRRRADDHAQVRRLQRRVADLEAEIAGLVRHLGQGLVTEDEFRAARDAARAELDGCQERLTEVSRATRSRPADRRGLAADVAAAWMRPDATVEVRRAMIGQLVERVIVTSSPVRLSRGRAGGASNASVEVVPAWL